MMQIIRKMRGDIMIVKVNLTNGKSKVVECDTTFQDNDVIRMMRNGECICAFIKEKVVSVEKVK